MNQPPPLRVLVADDQELVRAGFRLILEAAGFAVVGEAADGAQAVALAAAECPDVVLMDIRMPVMDGLAATRQLTAPGAGGPKVVILTTFDLDDYVYEALRSGATGFLLKDAPRADLIAAVRVAAAGDALLAPSVTRRLIEAFAHPARARHPAAAGPGPVECRDRRRPGRQRRHGQDTRRASAGQAGPARPRAGRHPRLRNGRGHPRPPRLTANSRTGRPHTPIGQSAAGSRRPERPRVSWARAPPVPVGQSAAGSRRPERRRFPPAGAPPVPVGHSAAGHLPSVLVANATFQPFRCHIEDISDGKLVKTNVKSKQPS
jgi:DNA-binding NarL/FixJ family response regulator